jgi:hypothetical protein
MEISKTVILREQVETHGHASLRKSPYVPVGSPDPTENLSLTLSL